MNKRTMLFGFVALSLLGLIAISSLQAEIVPGPFFDEKRYRLWQKDIEERIRKSPERYDLVETLVKIAILNEDFTTALKSVRALQKEQPNNVELYLDEIRVLRYQHNIGECIAKIKAFEKKYPKHRATAQLVARIDTLQRSASLEPVTQKSKPLPAYLSTMNTLRVGYGMMADSLLFVRTHLGSSIYLVDKPRKVDIERLFEVHRQNFSQLNAPSQWQNIQVPFFFSEKYTQKGAPQPIPQFIFQQDNQYYMMHSDGALEELADIEATVCSFPAVSPWFDYFVTACQGQLRLYLRSLERWRLHDEDVFKEVETPFRESAPRISPDGRYLYFASDGHPGFGGYDQYVSEISYAMKDEKGIVRQIPSFATPKNMRWLNNYRSESSPFQPSGKSLFYVRRYAGRNRFFRYAVPASAPKAHSVVPVRVMLKDQHGKDLQGMLELTSAGKQLPLALSTEATPATDWVALKPGAKYQVSVRSRGYFYRIEALTAPRGRPYHIHEVVLTRMVPGAAINAKGILFARRKAGLRPEARAEVRAIYRLLIDNPGVTISIEGHTDDVGSDDYNQDLSEQRASMVRDTLLKMGIPGDRMKTRGWGEKKPIASNKTAKGRTQNRRTEVRILSVQ